MARTTEHFIWTGDYADRLELIKREASAATADTTPMLGGEVDPLTEIAERYEALKAEANEAGLRVVLRGLRDDEWDDLVEAHPPRTEGPRAESDASAMFNERTGTRALVAIGIVDPVLPSRTRFDDWVEENNLTRGDMTALAARVWNLTHGTGYADPKFLPPLPTRDDDENSE